MLVINLLLSSLLAFSAAAAHSSSPRHGHRSHHRKHHIAIRQTTDENGGDEAANRADTAQAPIIRGGVSMYDSTPQVTALNVTAEGDLCQLPPAPDWLSKPELGAEKRYIAYWSVYHGLGKGKLPDPKQMEGMTHLVLSFVNATNDFTDYQSSEMTDWSNTTTEELRVGNSQLKVMAAFGGWGGDAYFRTKSNTTEGRTELAQKFAAFVDAKKLDGLDLDWEFPVGNGEVYLKEPNNPCEKYWMVDLTHKVRHELDKLGQKNQKRYILSVAVPGRIVDIRATDAYNQETIPEIEKSIDHWNLMTYDMMNRRDGRAVHHAGRQAIEATVKEYTSRKMTAKMMTVGFPMYAKWFHAPAATCDPAQPIGCDFGHVFENVTSGESLGNDSTMIFNPEMNTAAYLGEWGAGKLKNMSIDRSWIAAQAVPAVDAHAGAHSWWDAVNKVFWTWLSVNDVKVGCEAWIGQTGGVFIWALNQDRDGATGGKRIAALAECVAKYQIKPAGSGSLPPADQVEGKSKDAETPTATQSDDNATETAAESPAETSAKNNVGEK